MANARARLLRKNLTDAERKLWQALSRFDQAETHFRKQSPIGSYVVDFVCHKARLVIEVDGGQHAMQTAKDGARTAWLESQGYRLTRFWNNEVLGNLDGVVAVIAEALKAPHPQPLPTRGRGVACGTLSANDSPPPCGEGLGVGEPSPSRGSHA